MSSERHKNKVDLSHLFGMVLLTSTYSIADFLICIPFLIMHVRHRIWSFGPKRVGPILLVNKIPGYVRKHFFDVEKPQKQAEESVTNSLGDDEVVDVSQQDERLGILD